MFPERKEMINYNQQFSSSTWRFPLYLSKTSNNKSMGDDKETFFLKLYYWKVSSGAVTFTLTISIHSGLKFLFLILPLFCYSQVLNLPTILLLGNHFKAHNTLSFDFQSWVGSQSIFTLLTPPRWKVSNSFSLIHFMLRLSLKTSLEANQTYTPHWLLLCSKNHISIISGYLVARKVMILP